MAANREALENCARMTSTSFNVGLADNTRLSSRVLRPPGGGHTDIFGGEPEPQQIQRRGPPASSIGFVVGQEEPKPAANGTDASSQNGQKSPQEAAPAPPAAEAPEPKASPVAPAPAPEPAKVEPPKRVRVPPGGFSSGLW